MFWDWSSCNREDYWDQHLWNAHFITSLRKTKIDREKTTVGSKRSSDGHLRRLGGHYCGTTGEPVVLRRPRGFTSGRSVGKPGPPIGPAKLSSCLIGRLSVTWYLAATLLLCLRPALWVSRETLGARMQLKCQTPVAWSVPTRQGIWMRQMHFCGESWHRQPTLAPATLGPPRLLCSICNQLNFIALNSCIRATPCHQQSKANQWTLNLNSCLWFVIPKSISQKMSKNQMGNLGIFQKIIQFCIQNCRDTPKTEKYSNSAMPKCRDEHRKGVFPQWSFMDGWIDSHIGI